MKRFLFTTLPSNDLGLLTRSLPIARELAERGDEVAFCSPGIAPNKLITDAGFENLIPKHPLYYLMSVKADLPGLRQALRAGRRDFGLLTFFRELLRAAPTRLAPVSPEIWNMDHMLAMIGLLNENFLRANCEALGGLMDDYRPDAVVDFWNPFACIAARARGLPLATVIQSDMHPRSQGFIWWKEAPPELPSALPAVNKVLAGYGLAPLAKSEELFVGDLTMAVGIPETDPLPEGANVTYLGPILWQKGDASLPEWVEHLSREKPLIWVYPGNPRYMPIRTPMDSDVILRACFAVLPDLDLQVVLTSGHHPLPEEFYPLPPNFHYAPYLPGLALAERSDLLIHHGGYGSCQTGLSTGTPAVIIPTFSERESNARRVAAAGAGEFVLPTGSRKKRVQAEALRAAAEKILSEPTYTENAQRICKKMLTYGGAAEAACQINEFS